jgi:hypothetical protein
LRDRVDYFNHDRFRGYVSVHSVPAYTVTPNCTLALSAFGIG